MATLVLQVVGTAVGSIFGPVGAAIGAAVGGIAGAAIDQTLLGSTTRRSGPRLDALRVMSSTEGAPIPRLYGAMRVGGQVIWATALEEHVSTRKVGQKGARQTVTEYSYSANFAVALCEGPIAHVRRVWADGKPLDLSGVVLRVHRGDEDQTADPLIVVKEGSANAPAYRGTAYVVFESLALEEFGNRIPQLSFEVIKPVGGIESMLQAVTLIPGAGEFAYEDRIVTAHPRAGVTEAVNRHQLGPGSDIEAALDELQALCPRLQHVSLVVSWFGDDLRAGHCTVAPRVEGSSRSTRPVSWRVAGLERGEARLVSTVDGKPAYGGTPSDESVIRCIQALRVRGIGVTLYPFLMMDVAIGNALPNPTGGTGQPAYPWRGRITCHPAPGQAGTVDATSAAVDQVAGFFGTAAPGSFSHAGGAVTYSGPAEWSYRRLILHYAHLAEAAGGVDAFVIGSELIGLTRVRQAAGVYPAVQKLVALAGDVRAVLRSGTRIVYGADWTEYGAHVLDGASEVRFPLDPLWASPAIDAVAIDWYAPLSDWRDDTGHLDAGSARSVYDLAYLRANVAGGEGFDWYYASEADRLAQTRSAISDGAFHKPWTFRQKDLVCWWGQPHVERMGGVELPGPTAWVPASKPIWLLEAGCPSVDKGSNRPSTFPDPKSSENGLPVFSNGAPDTLIQARAIEALLSHFDATLPASASAANPVSTVYGGPMLDAARIYLWAFDARPYPAFPSLTEVWADGPNWRLGHWLTGRLGLPTLDRLVAAILADYDVPAFDVSALDAAVPGAVIDRPMTARAALEPIAALFSAQAVDRAGVITFIQAGRGTARVLGSADLVLEDRKPLVARSRGQETELPREVNVSFLDPEADYAAALESSRRLATESCEERSFDLGLALPRGEAARRADIVLQDAWIARERAGVTVPRSALALEPGDLVTLDLDGRPRLHAVTAIADGSARILDLRRIEPAVFDQPVLASALPSARAAKPRPLPHVLLLDLPAAPDGSTVFQWIAATAKPWPGALNLWRSVDGAGFTLAAQLTRPATIGHLLADLPPGPASRWDRRGALEVTIDGSGDLVSATDGEVLDGANRLALPLADGGVEILQFAEAALVSAGVFRLSGLLRGQGGTEHATTVLAGSALVLLDEAVQPLVTSLPDVGRPIRWRVGPAGVDQGDDAVLEVSQAATLRSLQPLSPVHAWARREAGGIRLGWIRRTRVGGDTWSTEVPLGEEREVYEVDVLDGGAVRRTLSATEPGLLYAAADELADFGAAQAALSVRIVQLSTAAGRGLPEEVTLHV